jgi:hypothetical protein
MGTAGFIFTSVLNHLAVPLASLCGFIAELFLEYSYNKRRRDQVKGQDHQVEYGEINNIGSPVCYPRTLVTEKKDLSLLIILGASKFYSKVEFTDRIFEKYNPNN